VSGEIELIDEGSQQSSSPLRSSSASNDEEGADEGEGEGEGKQPGAQESGVSRTHVLKSGHNERSIGKIEFDIWASRGGSGKASMGSRDNGADLRKKSQEVARKRAQDGGKEPNMKRRNSGGGNNTSRRSSSISSVENRVGSVGRRRSLENVGGSTALTHNAKLWSDDGEFYMVRDNNAVSPSIMHAGFKGSISHPSGYLAGQISINTHNKNHGHHGHHGHYHPGTNKILDGQGHIHIASKEGKHDSNRKLDSIADHEEGPMGMFFQR